MTQASIFLQGPQEGLKRAAEVLSLLKVVCYLFSYAAFSKYKLDSKGFSVFIT